MTETVAALFTARKIMIMIAPALSSVCQLKYWTRTLRSTCHDTFSLGIKNEHQATTDMLIVFGGDYHMILMIFFSTDYHAAGW